VEEWTAADSCSFIAYVRGESGSDIEHVAQAMHKGTLVLPAPVLTEILSAPALTEEIATLFQAIPTLPLLEGYWVRVGLLRARILAGGLKARLGDAMIAQCCIDHAVTLITRDADFRHYATHGGLYLAC
jgi:hypothetical protein